MRGWLLIPGYLALVWGLGLIVAGLVHRAGER